MFAQVYYEEYIGDRFILRSKPGKTYTTDGFFGKYRFYVLVSFHSSYTKTETEIYIFFASFHFVPQIIR